MKATWTKVYHGPGYPVDGRREEFRRIKVITARVEEIANQYNYHERQTAFARSFFFGEPLALSGTLGSFQIIDPIRITESTRIEVAHISAEDDRLGIFRLLRFLPGGREILAGAQRNPVGHVDSMIREVDRDERHRRQKEMGRLFVKYGVVTKS